MIGVVADVRPFRALRYSAQVELPNAICPPFDIISPEQQQQLHERDPHNAVRIELAIPNGGDRYQAAASTLASWRDEGAVSVDPSPAYYLYEQRFEHSEKLFTRRMLFARVRLEPWSAGVVLPHEHTFGAPKEDRLRLLRAINLQASPIFMIYRDRAAAIDAVLTSAADAEPDASFDSDDGQSHTLHLIADQASVAALRGAFDDETLYIADGHHRYETLLGFRDEVRAKAGDWTGDEAPNFAMAALAAAGDPGMLVLPIHRVTAAGDAWTQVGERLSPAFNIRRLDSLDALNSALSRAEGHAWGLIASDEPAPLLLTVADARAVDALLPQDRSHAWRALDYSIANHAIMRHALGLTNDQMTNYSSVWFAEDATEAERDVRTGLARYAVILNPIPVNAVLDLAEDGERMPQKSTFFYPKVPTGLLFNPLDE
jgi:uncharacterized protein (DUF1015 family)